MYSMENAMEQVSA